MSYKDLLVLLGPEPATRGRLDLAATLAERFEAASTGFTHSQSPRSPYHGEGRWPERVDERTSQEPENSVQSASVLCSNGCGLDIGVKNGRIVGVRGRALDAVNRGRLGPKGLHGWEANNSTDRLTRPLIGGWVRWSRPIGMRRWISSSRRSRRSASVTREWSG